MNPISQTIASLCLSSVLLTIGIAGSTSAQNHNNGAIRDSPFPKTSVQEGFRLFEEGQYAEAKRAMDKAVQLDANDVLARFIRAHAELQLKQLDETIADCAFIVSIKYGGLTEPSLIADVHYLLGTAYGEKNRLDDAERELKTSLEILPQKIEAMFNLGRVYYFKGELKSAEVEFERILSVEPDHPQAKRALDALREGKAKTSERIKQPVSVKESIIASILFIPAGFVSAFVMNLLLSLLRLVGLGVAGLPGYGMERLLEKFGLAPKPGSAATKFNWGMYIFTWAGPVYLISELLIIVLYATGVALVTGLFINWFPGAETALQVLAILWLWLSIGITGLIAFGILVWILKMWLGALGIYWSIWGLLFR